MMKTAENTPSLLPFTALGLIEKFGPREKHAERTEQKLISEPLATLARFYDTIL
jgi:hypothetical protein